MVTLPKRHLNCVNIFRIHPFAKINQKPILHFHYFIVNTASTIYINEIPLNFISNPIEPFFRYDEHSLRCNSSKCFVIMIRSNKPHKLINLIQNNRISFEMFYISISLSMFVSLLLYDSQQDVMAMLYLYV